MIADKIPGILDLPLEQRYQLAAELWSSVAYAQADIPMSVQAKELLDARFSELEKNPGDVIPWEDIKSRLEKRH